MTANILTAIGVALIVGSAIFGGGGSNGAAELPAAGPSVPPARLFPLGSVTRPTATPYTAVSSIEDGRDHRRGAHAPSELPLGVTWANALPALPLSIEALICAMPWPCSEALSVMYCESSGNPNAYNASSGASGLYQMLPRYHGWRLGEGESFFDAAANIRVAWELWNEQGFEPWRACR